MAKRQYTAADLYGADGRPHAADIHQDKLFNCYFLAPIGTLGEQQPERIQEAIRFNAETGDFTVSLYRPPNPQQRAQGLTDPIQETITVSQADIRHNINKDGGGTVDNNTERNGPLWPTVIEAGFAEVYGRDAGGRVNLNRAYRDLGNFERGGSLSDGVYALTGESGRTVRIESPLAPPFEAIEPVESAKRPAAPAAAARPFDAPTMGVNKTLDAAYTELEQALKANKPVSLSTMLKEVSSDGLEEKHAYMVMGVSRNPQTNEAQLTLRNPYGNNERAGEGNRNIGAGWNTSNPEITVSLNTLVREGSFAEFNIGPAPRVQTQQQNAPALEPNAPSQTAPAQPAASPPPANDITNNQHPGHLRYQQALTAIEQSPNIPPGTFAGERLQQSAANLAYASLAGEARVGIGGHNESLSRIDFVVFNKDRSALIAGEGEFGNPAAQKAWLSSAQDNGRSLSDASQRTHTLLQDPEKLALANPALQQAVPTAEPKLSGPSR